MKAPTVQVHAYLDAESKLEFEAYAEALGLEAGTLLRLLLVREDRRRCLNPPGVTRRIGPERTKVTARCGVELALRFAEHASRRGHNRSDAARELVLAELEERWLERCLGEG